MNQAAFLTRDEESGLLARWQEEGDRAAMDRLVVSHLPLVRKAAARFKDKARMDDYMQSGSIGLIKAADKFDRSRGLRFATYAQWWVRQEITDAVLDARQLVKQSRSGDGKRAFWKDGPAPVVSLSARIGPGDVTLADAIPSDDPSPEDIVLGEMERGRLVASMHAALETLKPRSQEVIRRRFLADPPETLDTISQSYGVSRERIRQIEEVALEAMRKVMTRGMKG